MKNRTRNQESRIRIAIAIVVGAATCRPMYGAFAAGRRAQEPSTFQKVALLP